MPDVWSWEALDLAGAARAVVVPRTARIRRVLNGPSTVELGLDAEGAAELATTARLVRGWRRPPEGGARVVRATGRVDGLSAIAQTDAIETLNVRATDALGRLAFRQVQETVEYVAESPRDIVAFLIALQDIRDEVGLIVASSASSGPPRDRTYEPGKVVLEAIDQLAGVDDGFYYRVDPVEGTTTYSELVVLYPDPGSDSSAVFGYGAGTEGNLASIEADVRPPVNSVTAYGAGDGADQLRATRTDAGSIATYGVVDASVTFPDVVVPETLDQYALDALRPSEERTFRVGVGVDLRSEALSVPAPWDDFDVGDTVLLNLRGQTAVSTFNGRAVVTAFTVEVDQDGREKLTALDLQTTGAT